MPITRFTQNPLIYPELGLSIKENINGPSLIKVPSFVSNPLGKYYLYFAHHQGQFIRMAYADNIEGPYTLFESGVFSMESSPFSSHIASPDVHVDYENGKIFMIYHGCGFDKKPNNTKYSQVSCYAQSGNGLSFISDSEFIGPSYLRVFSYKTYWYGCDGGAKRQWYRAKNPAGPYETGPSLEIPEENYPKGNGRNDLDIKRMRHLAFDTSIEKNQLNVYYSNVGDEPERIKRVTVDLSQEWTDWTGSDLTEICRSTTPLEGIEKPVTPSKNGSVHEIVHQLRDPYIYCEKDKKYLIYSHGGEMGISGAVLRGLWPN